MLATVLSRTRYGMEAPEVTIDVHLSAGLQSCSIVGLPEAAVRESKDRVRSAVTTDGFEWPAGCITVDLAPADSPKDGGRSALRITRARPSRSRVGARRPLPARSRSRITA